MAYIALLEDTLEEMSHSIPPLHSQDTENGSEYLVAYEHLHGAGWDWYLIEYDPEAKVALCFMTNGVERKLAYVTLLAMALTNGASNGENAICVERPWPARTLGQIKEWRKAKGTWDDQKKYEDWLYERRAKAAGIESDQDLVALYRVKDESQRRDLGSLGGLGAPLSFDAYEKPTMFDLHKGGTSTGIEVCENLNINLQSREDTNVMMGLGDVAVVKRGHNLHGYYCDTVGHKDVTHSLFAEVMS